MAVPSKAQTAARDGGASDTVATLLRTADGVSRRDAELLLAHCMGTGHSQLYAHPERAVPIAVARRYHALTADRRRGVPLAYLRGWQGFWTLKLQVDRRVLVPRPESELLVEAALARVVARRARCAELGTGSGAIALALARERPEWRILAVERCADALAVARANQLRLRCHNAQLIRADWGAALAERRFDLLVANPPYVDVDDAQLRQAPLSCEPRGALAADAGGMGALRQLVSELPSRLASGGWLMLEHAPWQAAELRCSLRAQGCLAVATLRDLAGLERLSMGHSP